MNDKHSFRYLWIGQTLANSGDLFYIVGLITIVYSLTQSATIMAVIPFVIAFSRFFGGIIAPWVIDRYALKQILIYSQLVKTILLVCLTIYVFTLLGEGGLFFVFLLISFTAFLDGWATPARNAMLPQLVPSHKLVRANSFLAVVDQIVQLGGWAVGGIFVAIFSGELLILVTAILFILSTIMMAAIQVKKQERKQTPRMDKLASLLEGWITIWKTPSLRTVAATDIIDAISSVVWIAAILYIYIEEVLHKSEIWWGYINSTFFAGLIVGGFISFRIESHLKKRLATGIFVGTIMIGLITLCFGFTTNAWLALVLSILVGIATAIKDISQQTVFQLTTSEEKLPKVFSARDAIMTGVFGSSTLLFGYLAEVFGVQVVFVVASVLLLLSAIWSYVRRETLKII
ncbi:MFS transporter [Bacillus solimangrovi]|uniref:Major facilitator superfamily (MFS) profile domain-containing protein n=1 Tax=Bacillus solimangrovi TaxID=1305675 RepID=A0A1E5LI54_9BACI|nr:MFS transporter [Bacillus solimangrovi]OEH93763.1 hypothetical protein BFG57_11295 [Bacillus solimangrovi]